MKILGIDPGVSGGIGYLLGQELAVNDLPVVLIGSTKQIVAPDLARMVRDYDPDVVVVETNAANGGNGSLANFSMALSMGVIFGVVGTLGYPLVRVKPREWQPKVGLGTIKGTAAERKEASRQRALELWPNHEGLNLKKHHNRADAALIAEAYRRSNQ